MTLGKSFKVFPSKVCSSQTRAHLKVLMNQNLIHRAVLFCFSYRACWINAPIPNTSAFCLATMGIFWFPYFSLNLYIHWCSYTFFLGNAPWVLMLIYLVSNSISPPKSYAKIKYFIFPKIWATESFQNEYVHAKSLQSWLTLCDAMDSSPPGSSVYGILQARMLEWVTISHSIWEDKWLNWKRSPDDDFGDCVGRSLELGRLGRSCTQIMMALQTETSTWVIRSERILLMDWFCVESWFVGWGQGNLSLFQIR